MLQILIIYSSLYLWVRLFLRFLPRIRQLVDSFVSNFINIFSCLFPLISFSRNILQCFIQLGEFYFEAIFSSNFAFLSFSFHNFFTAYFYLFLSDFSVRLSSFRALWPKSTFSFLQPNLYYPLQFFWQYSKFSASHFSFPV